MGAHKTFMRGGVLLTISTIGEKFKFLIFILHTNSLSQRKFLNLQKSKIQFFFARKSYVIIL